MALFDKKAAPATAKGGKHVKRINVSSSGDVSTFSMVDGSGSTQVDIGKFPAEIIAKLAQFGLKRMLTAGDVTLKDISDKAASLAAGNWPKKKSESGPKLIPAICEALANVAKAQGQGVHKPDLYAKMCDPKSYQARFFDVAGKLIEARKPQLRELRGKDDVQAALRQVKIARAKAKGKQEVSDLSALVA